MGLGGAGAIIIKNFRGEYLTYEKPWTFFILTSFFEV